MSGWIGVDLEVVDGVDVLCRLQHLRTQRHDAIVGGPELLDPQVEVDLLRRCPVGPVGLTRWKPVPVNCFEFAGSLIANLGHRA
jgi:hypothetical protein